MKTLGELFMDSTLHYPKKTLTIIGVNPIIQEITTNPQLFCDLLRTNHDLVITIYYESNTENFNQSLFYEKGVSKNKLDYNKLDTYRNRLIGSDKGSKKTAGLLEDVLRLCANEEERKDFRDRIFLYQNNLRHFVNIIASDDIIRFCFTTLDLPSVDMYREVTNKSDSELFQQLQQYISYLGNKKSGGKFISKPGDELIELYDMSDIPRGIYPRKAFYTTDYQRYSVWCFIFNRHGELLLQQRSMTTKDNRGLWDKSAGGHVDLKDSSTIETATRELVEELFLPEAEFTKFMRVDDRDIIDFGVWNIDKRPEKIFRQEFEGLAPNDWIVFRAIDRSGHPMTIRRKSLRKMHVRKEDKEQIEPWYTRFISDVYLFIAPENYIDTQDQVNELMEVAEIKGAQSAHKLISVEDLIEDISIHPELYTDDMDYMCSEQRWLLIEFAESIKYIFHDYNERKEE